MLENFDLPTQGDLLNCDKSPYRLHIKEVWYRLCFCVNTCLLDMKLPCARHHNSLLITDRSWILTISIYYEQGQNFIKKNLPDDKEMVSKNGVKHMQAADDIYIFPRHRIDKFFKFSSCFYQALHSVRWNNFWGSSFGINYEYLLKTLWF